MHVVVVTIGPGPVPGAFGVQLTSRAGEASESVGLDVDGLAALRDELQQAVLASGVATRGVISQVERPVRDVGQRLFTALLGTGQVAGLYRASAALAAADGDGLRVVLRMDDPALAGLPWEAMYDDALGGYLCQQEPLVRHVPVSRVPAPLTVAAPLRILGIAASPRGLPLLDVGREQEQLDRALARPVAEGRIELSWAPSATWADLQDLLLDDARPWHVVHFVGHGDFDSRHDTGVLALVGDDGRVHEVQARQFANLLAEAQPMPRLVTLNSCSGAETGEHDLFAGTAATLVRSGVTAVAAMQYKISDPAAIAFTRGFYAAIANNRGVDTAMRSGRRAIVGLSTSTLEWVTPVLYLRGDQTRLFTLSTSAGESVEPQPGPPKARPGRTAEPSAVGGPAREVKRLGGHRKGLGLLNWAVTDVAFSPAGDAVASSGGTDRTVRVWDVATGAERHALSPPFGRIGGALSVAFAPDGRRLAGGGSDTTIRIWDPVTGEEVRVLTGHGNSVFGLAFAPDGRTLASGSVDGTARIWRLRTGGQLHSFAHGGAVQSVAFSPDGHLLATCATDMTVRLWNPATGDYVLGLAGNRNSVHTVAFSPDGTLLASGGNDKAVRVWDVATGAALHVLTGHTGQPPGVRRVAFSPDGALLASCGSDQTIRLWDARTGDHVRTLTGHAKAVTAVAWSPDGRHLVSGSTDATIRLWG